MKKIIDILRLEIEASKANPSPPVGPALGLRGVNIMSFCKEFNAATKDYSSGVLLPTIIYVYEDKSFSFIIKHPSVSFCFKKVLNLNNNSSLKKHVVSKKLVYHIAELKGSDYNLKKIKLSSLFKSIHGTAKSMGFQIK